ncbi:MAG TPA: phosphoenolpyruvate carboxykinase (ATP), partial [Anaerolineae bacterium]
MGIQSKYGLDRHGLTPTQSVHWNLSPTELVEHAIRRGEGQLTQDGPFLAITKPHTGRSPNDKYTVREPSSEADIWWGNNTALSEEQFDRLHRRALAYLNERDLFVRDQFACADPANRLKVRLIDEMAWTNLFAHNLFIRPEPADLPDFRPDFTILHVPEMKADPAVDKTRTETVIAIHFAKKTILVIGTRYAGEVKKTIFTILNYLMPKKGVLSMHCSANIGPDGETALLFGLSGTGKTTLSADPHRRLIGDDEHGWGDDGVFNFEGGCYAKAIKLSAEAEPEIYSTTKRFGTVLENVVINPDTRALLLDLDTITENTRAAYPIDFVSNAVISGIGGHPRNVMFLTADAFGVLPPISKLAPEQALYHFLSGYTARLAGTER